MDLTTPIYLNGTSEDPVQTTRPPTLSAFPGQLRKKPRRTLSSELQVKKTKTKKKTPVLHNSCHGDDVRSTSEFLSRRQRDQCPGGLLAAKDGPFSLYSIDEQGSLTTVCESVGPTSSRRSVLDVRHSAGVKRSCSEQGDMSADYTYPFVNGGDVIPRQTSVEERRRKRSSRQGFHQDNHTFPNGSCIEERDHDGRDRKSSSKSEHINRELANGYLNMPRSISVDEQRHMRISRKEELQNRPTELNSLKEFHNSFLVYRGSEQAELAGRGTYIGHDYHGDQGEKSTRSLARDDSKHDNKQRKKSSVTGRDGSKPRSSDNRSSHDNDRKVSTSKFTHQDSELNDDVFVYDERRKISGQNQRHTSGSRRHDDTSRHGHKHKKHSTGSDISTSRKSSRSSQASGGSRNRPDLELVSQGGVTPPREPLKGKISNTESSTSRTELLKSRWTGRRCLIISVVSVIVLISLSSVVAVLVFFLFPKDMVRAHVKLRVVNRAYESFMAVNSTHSFRKIAVPFCTQIIIRFLRSPLADDFYGCTTRMLSEGSVRVYYVSPFLATSLSQNISLINETLISNKSADVTTVTTSLIGEFRIDVSSVEIYLESYHVTKLPPRPVFPDTRWPIESIDTDKTTGTSESGKRPITTDRLTGSHHPDVGGNSGSNFTTGNVEINNPAAGINSDLNSGGTSSAGVSGKGGTSGGDKGHGKHNGTSPTDTEKVGATDGGSEAGSGEGQGQGNTMIENGNNDSGKNGGNQGNNEADKSNKALESGNNDFGKTDASEGNNEPGKGNTTVANGNKDTHNGNGNPQDGNTQSQRDNDSTTPGTNTPSENGKVRVANDTSQVDNNGKGNIGRDNQVDTTDTDETGRPDSGKVDMDDTTTVSGGLSTVSVIVPGRLSTVSVKVPSDLSTMPIFPPTERPAHETSSLAGVTSVGTMTTSPMPFSEVSRSPSDTRVTTDDDASVSGRSISGSSVLSSTQPFREHASPEPEGNKPAQTASNWKPAITTASVLYHVTGKTEITPPLPVATQSRSGHWMTVTTPPRSNLQLPDNTATYDVRDIRTTVDPSSQPGIRMTGDDVYLENYPAKLQCTISNIVSLHNVTIYHLRETTTPVKVVSLSRRDLGYTHLHFNVSRHVTVETRRHDRTIVVTLSFAHVHCTNCGEYKCTAHAPGLELSAIGYLKGRSLPGKPQLLFPIALVEDREVTQPITCTADVGFPPGRIEYQIKPKRSPDFLSLGQQINSASGACANFLTSSLFYTPTSDGNGTLLKCVVINEHVGPVQDLTTVAEIQILPQNLCEGKPSNTTLRHPFTCSKFIRCNDDGYDVLQCPNELCFDVTSGQCGHTALTMSSVVAYLNEGVTSLKCRLIHLGIWRRLIISKILSSGVKQRIVTATSGVVGTTIHDTAMKGRIFANQEVTAKYEVEMNLWVYTLTCEDEGMYVCEVDAPFRVPPATGKIELKVIPEAPSITIPNEIIEASPVRGSFTCQASVGYPHGNLVWRMKMRNETEFHSLVYAETRDETEQNCSKVITSSFKLIPSLAHNDMELRCEVDNPETLPVGHTLVAMETIHVIPANFCLTHLGKAPKVHPYDCHQYVQCTEEYTYVQRCGSSHCFNPDSLRCDAPSTPKQDIVDPNHPCRPDRNGEFFHHPFLCNKYIWCVQGKEVIHHCPMGTLYIEGGQCTFDPDQSRCYKDNG